MNIGLVLENVARTETECFAYGGISDMFRGKWARRPGETVLVAIKQIRRPSRNDQTVTEHACKRLLREADLWTRLHHPHIAPLYGLVFERELPCFVMPYYKNGDVRQFLRSHAEVDKLSLICQLTAGLEYLHSNSIVHGDIKASNVMVTDSYRACLADFGTARALDVSGFTDTRLALSIRWTSPETLQEGAVHTFASDIWALGMTILEIYTGELPFDHITKDSAVIISLLEGNLPSKTPNINDAMWKLLKRCWAARPDLRPAVFTLTIVLSIMTSQTLTPQRVDTLINYLVSNSYSSKPPAGRSLRAPDILVVNGSPSKLSGTDVFHCRWPGCKAHFSIFRDWHDHQLSHWLSWQETHDGSSFKNILLHFIPALLAYCLAAVKPA